MILSLLLLSSCALFKNPEPVVITETVEVKAPIIPTPKELVLHDVHFYVVTDRNFAEFMERYERENGSKVYYAISVVDYERMAMNMADLYRYLQQQKQIILYYESYGE